MIQRPKFLHPLTVCKAVLFALLLVSGSVRAQIKVFPRASVPGVQQAKSRPDLDLHLQSSVTLPFWDDFSYGQNQPDTALWVVGENVRLETGTGIRPPTLFVATFDGLDKQGAPYSLEIQADGKADSLVSAPIDLSGLSFAEGQSVYISFFWQRKGQTEAPDSNDSLRLQFLQPDSTWVTAWSQPGNSAADTVFRQEILNVPASFHSSYFQFRFQSFGRLTGPFDGWLVDYIYLDKNRSFSDTTYSDRALIEPPTSLFEPYTAIPLRQFAADTSVYLARSYVAVNNLDDIDLFEPIEGNAFLIDPLTTDTLQVMIRDQSKLIFALDTVRYWAPPIIADRLPIDQDTLLTLEQAWYIVSNDDLLFRQNDTIRTRVELRDFFAYDDGEAEFSAGVNQRNGRIAVQFENNVPDTLIAVDIYFPAAQPQGLAPFVDVKVWKDLDDTPQSVIASRSNVTPDLSLGPNQFTRVELAVPVVVDGTFYVGFEQFVNEFVLVGLDKSTNSAEFIYIDVAGGWSQDENFEGSLMIRPVFGSFGDRVVSVPREDPFNGVVLFPNPAKQHITINVKLDDWEITDYLGRSISQKTALNHHGDQTVLDVSQLPTGVYVLRAVWQGNQKAFKFIKKR